jgi:hypothetical protein
MLPCCRDLALPRLRAIMRGCARSRAREAMRGNMATICLNLT